MLADFDLIMQEIESMDFDNKILAINKLREKIHAISPFNSEPVDFVKWVKNDLVHSNDYNPNNVAPPEMELLKLSIQADGYTQPIVSMADPDGRYEVIDGFHRHRVGKECEEVQKKVHGYLPLVQIREERLDRSDRMASTIRHNRARGKHKVEAMSDMVIELKRRNWSDEKICKNLGMDQDEVLRLCQISGLSEIFSNQEFSKSWDPVGNVSIEDFDDISGCKQDYIDEKIEVKTANTNDDNRIFHTFEKWECHSAGFYESKPPEGLKADDCKRLYAELLSNEDAFSIALNGVITEWKNSCEHYLTNSAMNRIAWLGQASLCYQHGIPSDFRSGYQLLTQEQQLKADQIALIYLNKWLFANGKKELTMEDANPSRQSDIY